MSNLDLLEWPGSIPTFQQSRRHASSDDFSHLLQESVSALSCERLARHRVSCRSCLE